MNICVCIKQVPDTNEIKVDPVTHTLVRKGVPSIVNPFDTYAQEVGCPLKRKIRRQSSCYFHGTRTG